jgi:hypothetical protein
VALTRAALDSTAGRSAAVWERPTAWFKRAPRHPTRDAVPGLRRSRLMSVSSRVIPRVARGEQMVVAGGTPCRLYRLVDDGKQLGEAVEIDFAAQADAEGRESPASIRARLDGCRPTRVVVASPSEGIPLFHLGGVVSRPVSWSIGRRRANHGQAAVST